MAHISVGPKAIHINLSLLDKMVSFHGSMEVDLLHIEHAEPYRGDTPKVRNIYRFRGQYVPGKVAIGSESIDADNDVFYDVRDPSKAIAIELTGEPYTRMVVEVEGRNRTHIADLINQRAMEARQLVRETQRIHEELAYA